MPSAVRGLFGGRARAAGRRLRRRQSSRPSRSHESRDCNARAAAPCRSGRRSRSRRQTRSRRHARSCAFSSASASSAGQDRHGGMPGHRDVDVVDNRARAPPPPLTSAADNAGNRCRMADDARLRRPAGLRDFVEQYPDQRIAGTGDRAAEIIEHALPCHLAHRVRANRRSGGFVARKARKFGKVFSPCASRSSCPPPCNRSACIALRQGSQSCIFRPPQRRSARESAARPPRRPRSSTRLHP